MLYLVTLPEHMLYIYLLKMGDLMDKNSENWEHGIRDDIGITQINESPVIIGEKSFKYIVSGLNWGNQFHTDYIEKRFKEERIR